MKRILMIALLLSMSACATKQNYYSDEVSGGVPDGWTSQQEADYWRYRATGIGPNGQTTPVQPVHAVPEEPDPSQLVERVCITKPIYNMYGHFVRTSTKCR